MKGVLITSIVVLSVCSGAWAATIISEDFSTGIGAWSSPGGVVWESTWGGWVLIRQPFPLRNSLYWNDSLDPGSYQMSFDMDPETLGRQSEFRVDLFQLSSGSLNHSDAEWSANGAYFTINQYGGITDNDPSLFQNMTVTPVTFMGTPGDHISFDFTSAQNTIPCFSVHIFEPQEGGVILDSVYASPLSGPPPNVPEPATISLLSLGCVSMALRRFRRK
jgi:hypothetical protein